MTRYVWPSGYSSAFCVSIDVDAESPQIWKTRATGIHGLNQLEQRRFGLREGIFHILDTLDRYGVRASFFVPGYEASTRPWLLEALAARGHELGLHGFYHEVPTELSVERFRETIEQAEEIFIRTLGKKPAGYRSPAWEMTPAALAVLREKNLYDSSLSGYDHPYEIDGVTEVSVQWPLDDPIFFRFMGGGVDSWQPMSTRSQMESWIQYSEDVARFGGVNVCTIHPFLTGRPGRIRLLEALLDYCCGQKHIWVTTVGEVAEYHNHSVNKGVYAETAMIPTNLVDGM